MKNNIFFTIIFLISFHPLLAENLNIESKNISIDKITKLTIFKENVVAKDINNNIFKTEYAEYKKDLKSLESKGKTTIKTSEGFFVVGENIIFDNNNKYISSNYPAIITDLENNKIYLDKFKYSTKESFFSSTGNIKVIDSNDNTYNFSQIYIDEKKREIIGTDSKAFLSDENFKQNKKNKPRIFSNTVKMNSQTNEFTKSVFTLCDYRKNDKCPPWSLQASKMLHDKKKKTIYYDNAVIKFFDIPIFYFPKLSQPDHTVDRRTGFLIPSFVDSKNLGSSISIPYFWALNKNRDLTLTSRVFTSEHPLILGEYRHALKDSNLILDFGRSEGYKKTTSTKTAGSKSHFFAKFLKSFKGSKNSDNSLAITVQNVSNNKYLKLYKIDTDLVQSEVGSIEKTLDFTHENENLFLGFQASAYETLSDSYEDKYEYILPNIILDKNLFNNEYGNTDLRTNLKVNKYDTNKFTSFFINDIYWKSKNFNFSNGFKSNFLSNFKNVNYETKNAPYKSKPTNELFGALGYLTEIELYKERGKSKHFLTPKMLFKYAPDHMRNEAGGSKLNVGDIFGLNKSSSYNNFDGGLSASLGFNYQLKEFNKEIDFSIGQVISEKENQKKSSRSSLDQRFSDVVGASSIKINNNVEMNYNFSLDQNYKELNYNEVGTKFDFNPIKFDFNYLQEKEHIGNQEYLKAKVDFAPNSNTLFSAGTKRSLITNSAEYYNLSYEYMNDCLKAGLVYRREFYNDSELEAENSLMFKITLVPFGSLSSPSFK